VGSDKPSAAIRARVEAARQIQRERLAAFRLHCNAHVQARHIRKFCPLDEQGQRLLEMAADRLGLSARSYSRILKVARTIAASGRGGRNPAGSLCGGDSVSGLEGGCSSPGHD
jgi:magnesium chelatase family protein